MYFVGICFAERMRKLQSWDKKRDKEDEDKVDDEDKKKKDKILENQEEDENERKRNKEHISNVRVSIE